MPAFACPDLTGFRQPSHDRQRCDGHRAPLLYRPGIAAELLADGDKINDRSSTMTASAKL
jgi:hypothetical protein